jgi:hypothetical protein
VLGGLGSGGFRFDVRLQLGRAGEANFIHREYRPSEAGNGDGMTSSMISAALSGGEGTDDDASSVVSAGVSSMTTELFVSKPREGSMPSVGVSHEAPVFSSGGLSRFDTARGDELWKMAPREDVSLPAAAAAAAAGAGEHPVGFPLMDEEGEHPQQWTWGWGHLPSDTAAGQGAWGEDRAKGDLQRATLRYIRDPDLVRAVQTLSILDEEAGKRVLHPKRRVAHTSSVELAVVASSASVGEHRKFLSKRRMRLLRQQARPRRLAALMYGSSGCVSDDDVAPRVRRVEQRARAFARSKRKELEVPKDSAAVPETEFDDNAILDAVMSDLDGGEGGVHQSPDGGYRGSSFSGVRSSASRRHRSTLSSTSPPGRHGGLVEPFPGAMVTVMEGAASRSMTGSTDGKRGTALFQPSTTGSATRLFSMLSALGGPAGASKAPAEVEPLALVPEHPTGLLKGAIPVNSAHHQKRPLPASNSLVSLGAHTESSLTSSSDMHRAGFGNLLGLDVSRFRPDGSWLDRHANLPLYIHVSPSRLSDPNSVSLVQLATPHLPDTSAPTLRVTPVAMLASFPSLTELCAAWPCLSPVALSKVPLHTGDEQQALEWRVEVEQVWTATCGAEWRRLEQSASPVDLSSPTAIAWLPSAATDPKLRFLIALRLSKTVYRDEAPFSVLCGLFCGWVTAAPYVLHVLASQPSRSAPRLLSPTLEPRRSGGFLPRLGATPLLSSPSPGPLLGSPLQLGAPAEPLPAFGESVSLPRESPPSLEATPGRMPIPVVVREVSGALPPPAQPDPVKGGVTSPELVARSTSNPERLFLEHSRPPGGVEAVSVPSLRPTSEELELMGLREGPNRLSFRVEGTQAEVECTLYLWKPTTKIVISDVDGTITKSDTMGHIMYWVGRDWTQEGVASLFANIKRNGYQIVYLTSRAIGQVASTKDYLDNVVQSTTKDDSSRPNKLPDGPVITSPDRLFDAFTREVIRRQPQEFKIAALSDIRKLFPSHIDPFYAGFGNRETDEISYRQVGVPPNRIFIIDKKGDISQGGKLYCHTYSGLNSMVDAVFPPIVPVSPFIPPSRARPSPFVSPGPAAMAKAQPAVEPLELGPAEAAPLTDRDSSRASVSSAESAAAKQPAGIPSIRRMGMPDYADPSFHSAAYWSADPRRRRIIE